MSPVASAACELTFQFGIEPEVEGRIFQGDRMEIIGG